MASCFCGCGAKVKFGIRAINSRGEKITGLLIRIDALLADYAEQDEPPLSENLQAFRDEGMLYALNLATFIHLGESPPSAFEGITRDWLARERKLHLDARNPERTFAGMLGGSFAAQGMSEADVDADLMTRIAEGDFDLFAALVPSRESAERFQSLAEVAVEAGVIEPPAQYEPAFRY